MKINFLKINGFGKLKDKEIELKEHINIIYGKNESGKSTLQKFIIGMLFGLSKNKNQKNISDFDKYYPWNCINFSGKINYELDNGEEFEVFRDFLKKNPTIYKNKNDITSTFKIDKTKGVTFFEEQTRIDEKTFLDTVVTEQANVKLSKSSQNNIIQKIANLISSGDENISYQKTLDKILKMQTERIGNNRTAQRPMNVLENKIINLEKEKFMFQDLNCEKNEVENELEKETIKLQESKYKLELLKEMKEYLDSSKIRVAELDFNKQLEKEYDEKILELKNKIDIKAKQNIRLQKASYKLQYIILAILLSISILLQALVKNIFIASIPIFLSILTIGTIFISKANKNKKIKQKILEIEKLQEKINKEIEILKKEKSEKSFQTKIKNERLYVEIQKNEEKLINKYSDKLDINYIQNIFSLETNDIIIKIRELEEVIEKQTLRIYTLNQEKTNIENEISKYQTTNFELENLKTEKEELNSLNTSFELAKKALEEAYQEMKENINPNFIANLSKMVEKISNGKYKNITFDDEKGLCVELETGEYISVEMLSIGTIDQLYLSLRILSAKQITTENLPIILDEAFAYFDDERIKNILEYIIKEYPNNQIIIFTCSNREIECLKNIGVENYNFVEL